MEEGTCKEDIGIHIRPTDAAGKGERHLRGLEGVLRKTADVGVVPAFCGGRFKKPFCHAQGPGDEIVDPRIIDRCDHACKSPANARMVDGCVDKKRRIDQVHRYRGREAGDPVVHVHLTGAVVDLRIAPHPVNLSHLNSAAKFLDPLPVVVGRPPDLAGTLPCPVRYGEVDILATVPFLPQIHGIHDERCVDLHPLFKLLCKDRLLKHPTAS